MIIIAGIAAGIIYVGIVGKVGWNFSGGYLGNFNLHHDDASSFMISGGLVCVLIIVLVLGTLPPKTKKVKEDNVELYWNDLKRRDTRSQMRKSKYDEAVYSEL